MFNLLICQSINRIRLEFKACLQVLVVEFFSCINRIRLEFKGHETMLQELALKKVLIESDWNLKEGDIFDSMADELVLIESDWNLKEASIRPIVQIAQY